MKWQAGLALTLLLLCFRPSEASSRSVWAPAGRPLRVGRAASGAVEFGLASWYGARFQHHLTASGVLFDDRKLTAAHRTLPLGTQVEVTNLKNGRSVTLRVTDRGPWIRGRLIDVSLAAAERLGFTHRGLAHVRVAVIRGSD